MTEIKWTKEQLDVIQARDCNILVAAAAGSGKTAILTQRIIEILTDDAHPVDIDRILVLTFTRAAAAEMRARISAGLDKKLEENPDNQRWRQQKMLLGYARICTLDSFCERLVRDHFDMLDIDASFRIADENELKILQQETMEDLLEGWYKSKDSAFTDLVEKYGSGRNDSALSDMILSVYQMAQGSPWPEKWLKQCVQIYEALSDPEEAARCTDKENAYFHQELAEIIRLHQQAIDLAAQPGGPAGYMKTLQLDREILMGLNDKDGHDSIREALLAVKWPKLAADRDKNTDPQKKKQAKAIRDQVKKKIGELSDGIYARDSGQIASEMKVLLPSVTMIVQLVQDFTEKFAEAKKDRCMLDFSDLSHMALRLLAEPPKEGGDEAVGEPTQLACTLRQYYLAIICDEYQDCNLVQETIMDVLSGERIGRYDRFMVGDMKQSIYRFRQAEAKLFADKYERYKVLPGCQVFDLNMNFRSRANVLEAVNFFFRRLMTKETGQIDYDDRAALKPGAAFPLSEGTDDKTDLILIDYDKENSFVEENNISRQELEAMAVAQEIRRITDPETGLSVLDPDTGSYRTAEYGDIAVLIRKVSGWGQAFSEVFSREGIPANVQSSSGFLAAWEIRIMKAVLAVIDNPYRDIEFAAVLHAPFCGIDVNQMADIRSCLEKGSYYEAALAYSRIHPDAVRLKTFLDSLAKLRQDAESLTLWELVREIYTLTGFDESVFAMPGGQRRLANLRKLEGMAQTFDSTGRGSLFKFVRYLDDLEKNEIDPGQPETAASAADCVRVISVHQSKGLEFPVVILAGCGDNFNKTDSRGSYILHNSLGIGLDVVNTDRRQKMPSYYKGLVARRIQADSIAEEMRILYVAMTRAKEKLIITGSTAGLEGKTARWKEMCTGPEETLRPGIVRSSNCFLDWLMPPLLQLDAGMDLLEANGQRGIVKEDAYSHLFRIRAIDASAIENGRAAEHAVHTLWREDFEKAAKESGTDPDIARALDFDDSWHYDYENLKTIKSKYSISELKEAHIDELFEIRFHFRDGAPEKKEPAFMQSGEEKESGTAAGTDYGTAFHRVMELMDFSAYDAGSTQDFVGSEISRMTASGRLSRFQAELVNRRDICRFLENPIAARMARAQQRGELHRESPFVAAVPVSMVDPSVESADEVIVQGVIDAWFSEDGKIVLLDYKTDSVPPDQGEEILRQRYKIQIDYYRFALEKYTGCKVTESCLYSVKLGKTVSL